MSTFLQHKTRNTLQSLIMVVTMCGLCGWLAWFLGGMPLAIYSAVLFLFIYLLNPVVSPELAMRLFNARPLSAQASPRLFQLMAELSRRAGLERPPKLYYVPSDVMNAFSTGTRRHAAIALSDGMLRRLEWRELTGVLAHEMMHIVHQDIRLMTFADLTSRLTGFLSVAGQFLFLINLPLLGLGLTTIPWLPIILMLVAPTVSTLMQLSLSRSREFEADLGAVEITDDPLGLASALNKLEAPRQSLLERIFLPPGPRIPDPSMLRTHPPTDERVRRLLEIADDQPRQHDTLIEEVDLSHLLAHQPYRPRWHRNGIWY